jgi:hypothetical protein
LHVFIFLERLFSGTSFYAALHEKIQRFADFPLTADVYGEAHLFFCVRMLAAGKRMVKREKNEKKNEWWMSVEQLLLFVRVKFMTILITQKDNELSQNNHHTTALTRSSSDDHFKNTHLTQQTNEARRAGGSHSSVPTHIVTAIVTRRFPSAQRRCACSLRSGGS